MLEHLPAWLGGLLRDRRASHEKLVAADPEVRFGADTFQLGSPAFADRARLPVRFAADGTEGTASLALIVEDPDAPSLMPMVHAMVWNIPADERRLAEGAVIAADGGGSGGDVGRNSFLRKRWLPPDPPAGIGPAAVEFAAPRGSNFSAMADLQ